MASYWLKYGNNVLHRNGYAVGKIEQPVDPYNPLGLPAYTIRVKITDGVTPEFRKGTAVQVSSSPNLWDLTYQNQNWSSLLYGTGSIVKEILGANSTGVTSLEGFCQWCDALTSVSLMDTSAVTSFNSAFEGCSSLAALPTLPTQSATSMRSMLSRCSVLREIPLFSTGSVTDMSSFCALCSSITEIPMLDVSSVTNMYHAFTGCQNLVTVPAFDLSHVVNCEGLFRACSKLVALPAMNLASTVYMKEMFSGCIRLTGVSVSNTGRVTTMEGAFRDCAFSTLPSLDTTNVSNMKEAFAYCRTVQSGALAMYTQLSTQTNPPTNHIDTFLQCGRDSVQGAQELAQIPQSWGGTMAE